MAKLEWQNAIFKMSNGKCKFIPIKIDDCIMPAILLQNLYIDFYNNGIDIGVSQLLDVLQGNNIFRESNVIFQNVVCYQNKISNSEYEFEFTATRFVEPASRYMILFKEKTANVRFNLLSDSMYQGDQKDDIQLLDGSIWSGYIFSVQRATTPKLPVRIKLNKIDGSFLAPL